MALIYNDWLYSQLKRIAKANQLEFLKFYVLNEQDFVKSKQILDKNSIFVVVKQLSTDITYNTKTIPIQIMIFTEQDSMELAMLVFKDFANKNNWTVTIDGDTYTKHQYNEPVVLQNFVPIGTGYRSILYVSGAMFEMEKVIDVYDVKIDDEDTLPIAFNFAYTLATDTQPLPDSFFVESVRTTQTIVFAMTLPAKQSQFIANCLEIVNGTITGNTSFNLRFKIRGVDNEFSYVVKLSGFEMATSPNDIPSVQIGLVV